MVHSLKRMIQCAPNALEVSILLHCRPTCAYFTDYSDKHHFHQLEINFWDDRDFFDPSAVRRSEEYDDIDQAIERLEEIGEEMSFDELSRLSASMLAEHLRQFQETGSMVLEGVPSEADMLAQINDAFAST